MAKRYLVAAAAAVVLALLAGWAISARAQATYSDTCLFRVAWYPQNVGNIDNAVTSQSLGSQAVKAAQGSGEIFAVAAAQPGVPQGTQPGHIQGETSITQDSDSGLFTARVTDADSHRATQLANAVCRAATQVVIGDLTRAQQAQVEAVTQRIVQLQAEVATLSAVPAATRTPEQSVRLNADLQAIARDQQFLPVALTTQPLDVEVIRPAVAATRNDTSNLTRNLIIAGVSGLLVAFFIVLLAEIVADVRPRPRPPLDDEGSKPKAAVTPPWTERPSSASSPAASGWRRTE